MPEPFAAQARRIFDQTAAGFDIPGLAIGVARSDRPAEHLFFGADASGRTLAGDSLFPVASITKLAVALAILRLVERRELALDDPVAAHLPDAACAPYAVTIRTLLSHTGGLPESYPEEPQVYQLGLTWPVIAQACLRTLPQSLPGTRVRYSAVGYSLLAVIVERITGLSFPAALAALVLEPLGVEAYLAAEPPRPPVVIDVGDSPFAGTDLEFFNSAFFRSLGEPAGGLLTTLDGVLRLIGAYRGKPGRFLRAETLGDAIRSQTHGLGGGIAGWFDLPYCPWGLGPGLHGAFPAWVPPEAGPGSFGHTGASSCIVWCDPAADVAWAILGSKMGDDGWCDEAFPAIGAAVLGRANDVAS